MIVEEMVQILGFDVDDSGLQNFRSSIQSTIGKMGALVAGAVSAGAALSLFLNAASEATTLTRFVRSIGVGIEEFQRLDFAARQAGGAAGSLKNALARLAKGVGDGLSGRNTSFIETLGEMGIQAKDSLGEAKNSLDLLLEIAEKISNATGFEQNRLLSISRSLGFGLDLGEFLKQGPDKIREIGREAIVVSKEMALASVAFTNSVNALKTSLNGLLTTEGKSFIDWLTNVTNKLTTLVRGELLGNLKGKLREVATLVGSAPKEVVDAFNENGSGVADGTDQGAFSRTTLAVVKIGEKMNSFLDGVNGFAAVLDQAFPFENQKNGGDRGTVLSAEASQVLDQIMAGLETIGGMSAPGLVPGIPQGPILGDPRGAFGHGNVSIEISNENHFQGVSDPSEVVRLLDQIDGDSLRESLDTARSKLVK